MKRLLSIGHSYVVGENRALPNAIARVGAGEWDVTVAAPLSYPGDLGEIVLRPGDDTARITGLPVHTLRWPHLMRYGAQLNDVMAQEWDVVHCWEEPYIAAAAQVARRTPRSAKLVFATFQNIAKVYPPPFGSIERYAMRRAHGWIAFGHTAAEALSRRNGYDNRPHRVIPPGVDRTRFAPDADAGARVRARIGWSVEGPPVVGFLGRFVPAKGWRTLTAALDALRAPWRALFVGGGPDERELGAWALQHPERVRVVRGVAHADVPAYLNAMDVLCAPSRTTPAWREQFGRMLIEAFACGVPVIASRSGEIPHVVGDAGILIDEGDEDAWRVQLTHLLHDPSLRIQLGAQGLERAITHFDIDQVAREHIDFFDTLLHPA